MEQIRQVWEAITYLFDAGVLDLAAIALITLMVGRYIFVMALKTRIWDRFSASLISVFIAVELIYLFSLINALTSPYPGEQIFLWFTRIAVLASATWGQYELSKELNRSPGVMFVRDRHWVKSRIDRLSDYRNRLMQDEEVDQETIDWIDKELDEMVEYKRYVHREIDHDEYVPPVLLESRVENNGELPSGIVPVDPADYILGRGSSRTE